MAAKSSAPKQGEQPGQPDVAWVDADRDYSIGLQNGKLVCRNPKGKTLSAVPKWLKETQQADSLRALAEWLDEHRSECQHTVQKWLARSLVIPREVVTSVWPDSDWRSVLENMVIAPADAKGKPDFEKAGLLKDVDPKRGLGIIDLDGETKWLKSVSLVVPHPILIVDLDELRELAGELSIEQPIDQLYRPVFEPTEEQKPLTSINDYANGVFEQLNFALSLCRRLGYPVRGGYATCRVWENNTMTQARYFVGDEYPESETWTGSLIFVGPDDQAIKVEDLGPVTFSEGVRMASAIYAKRKVEEEADTDE